MKTLKFTLIFIAFAIVGQAQTAAEIIKKSEDKARGESSIMSMTMKIVRPTYERSVSFKSWGKGLDYSMTLVTAPAKEKGQTFLKLKNDLWSWNPTIARTIKLPASMMSQGWMGSDFSNDDVMKQTSIVVDYEPTLVGTETVAGKVCHKIKLTARENAAVVWGSIMIWITKDTYLQLKTQYFDEDNELIRTEIASEIKKMDDREIPTKFEIIPEDNKGNRTIVTIDAVDFNVQIEDSFFSQQKMKSVR